PMSCCPSAPTNDADSMKCASFPIVDSMASLLSILHDDGEQITPPHRPESPAVQTVVAGVPQHHIPAAAQDPFPVFQRLEAGARVDIRLLQAASVHLHPGPA